MGSGTIDGNGVLGSGEPKKSDSGQGTKAFGLVASTGITISGISIKRGGWFSILATDCEQLTITGVTIAAARDAMDIMGCRHVLIEKMKISGGGDDAVKFGSDWSRGKKVDSFNVTVINSVVGSNGCNALQFGSETLGDFHDYWFENITITAAGKAGIGIVTMDGAQIYNVTYKHITMENTTSPIFMYIGGRLRSPLNKPPDGSGSSDNDTLVGGIHDILIEGVKISHVTRPGGKGKKGSGSNFSSSIEGQPPDKVYGLEKTHAVGPNIMITDIEMTLAGGGEAEDVAIVPPHASGSYPPRYLGVRPAYGVFIRRAKGVTLTDVTIEYDSDEGEGRPAIVLSDVSDVTLDGVKAVRPDVSGQAIPTAWVQGYFSEGRLWSQEGKAVDYDVGLRGECEGVSSGDLVTKKISGK